MCDFLLSADQLSKFHKDGYIGPFTLYQPEEMKEIFRNVRRQLLDTSKAIYKGNDVVSGVTNLTNFDRHLDVPFLFEHIRRPEIIQRLNSILGENIFCWRTEFFPKYPGDEGTDWHQVRNFSAVSKHKKPSIQWPENSDFAGAISIWTAFTESTVENGCLRIMPGTHGVNYFDESKEVEYNPEQINNVEKHGEKRGFFGYDFSKLKIDPNWSPDDSQAIPLIMQPGQFVIFWSSVLHSSYPHLGKTNAMRLGYTARYVPTYVKIYPDLKALEEFGGKVSLEKYRPVLVSGTDEFGYRESITDIDEIN